MVAVTVSSDGPNGGPNNRNTPKPRFSISTVGSDLSWSSRFAPKEITYSGFEGTYQEALRPDRQPLIRRDGTNLRKMSMEIFVGNENIENPITYQLKQLERLAETRRPLVVDYDPHTRGFWHITTLDYTSEERTKADSNEITRATVTIEFTEVAGPTMFTLNRRTKIIGTERPKSLKVKKGQTLAQIAKKYYGSTSPLIIKAIAKANKIKNPKHIKPGQKLKLP